MIDVVAVIPRNTDQYEVLFSNGFSVTITAAEARSLAEDEQAATAFLQRAIRLSK